MSLKLKDFAPPILGKAFRKFRPKRPPQDIFEGEGRLFKEALAGCQLYGEYGMGASTRWVLANTQADVIAVDTSREWVDHVLEATIQHDRLTAGWVDVGPVGDWGRPLSYAMRANFSSYVDFLWQGSKKPQVVLVDGRFRVSCFLRSLLSSEPGTRIIFDDYSNRSKYHVVEEFVGRVESYKRQALFVTPAHMDRKAIEQACRNFMYVID